MRGIKAPTFQPTPEQRCTVEMLAAFGISHNAICNELVRQGVPCRSHSTLTKKFRAELTHGRERLIASLGQRVLAIAMSDKPNALTAAQYLLSRLGGEQWRLPKDGEADAAGAEPNQRRVIDTDGVPVEMVNNVIFRMPPNGRDKPDEADVEETKDGPVIEGRAEGASGGGGG
jgi:hypothetical protein